MCCSLWLVWDLAIVLLSKAMVCYSKSDPWAQRWGRKKLINPESPYPAPPLPDIADMPFKSSSQKVGAFVSLLCLALPVTFSVWSQVAGGQAREDSSDIHSRLLEPQLLWSEEMVPLLLSPAAAAIPHATMDLEPCCLGFNGIKPRGSGSVIWSLG